MAEPFSKETQVGKRRKKSRAAHRKARAAVAERAGGRCEAMIAANCAGHGTQAHHKRLRSQGGESDLTNLMWVCLWCHEWIHSYPLSSQELGWIVTTAADAASQDVAL